MAYKVKLNWYPELHYYITICEIVCVWVWFPLYSSDEGINFNMNNNIFYKTNELQKYQWYEPERVRMEYTRWVLFPECHVF